MSKFYNRFKFSARLSFLHLLVSVAVGIMVAIWVYYFLYPYPYYLIAGSTTIFLMMIVVDVFSGPLCTFIVASPYKKRREVFWDFFVIASLQFSALGYGLYSLYVARPVYEVYENKSFRIVFANEAQIGELNDALPQFKHMPNVGVSQIGTRESRNSEDQLDSISMSFAGIEIGLRPSWWVGYEDSIAKVKNNYLPVDRLFDVLAEQQRRVLEKSLDHYKLTRKNTYFLPLDNSNYEDWIVLLNEQAKIVGYSPVDGYKK